MTTTPLPPVRRAAAALTKAVADDLWATSTTGDVYDVVVKCENESWRENAERIGAIAAENIRPAFSAALDVEEMAREMFVADSQQDRDFVLGIWRTAPDDQAVKKHWRRIATDLRAALLGVDQ